MALKTEAVGKAEALKAVAEQINRGEFFLGFIEAGPQHNSSSSMTLETTRMFKQEHLLVTRKPFEPPSN